MLDQIRNSKLSRLTLSVAVLSLFMLSSPLSFAGDNDSSKPAAEITAGLTSGYATYLSNKAAKNGEKTAAEIKKSNQALAKDIADRTAKPYADQLKKEPSRNSEALREQGRIESLEAERQEIAKKLDLAKNGKASRTLRTEVVKAFYSRNGGKPTHEIIKTRYITTIILPQNSHGIPDHLNYGADTSVTYSQKMPFGGGAPYGFKILSRGTVPPVYKKADPIDIPAYERRLTEIGKKIEQLKLSVKSDPVVYRFNNDWERANNASKVNHTDFQVNTKVFSESEAAELTRAHEQITTLLNDGESAVKSASLKAKGLRFLGSGTAVLSGVSLVSAVSDLVQKDAASTLSDGYAPAQQQAGSASAQSFK